MVDSRIEFTLWSEANTGTAPTKAKPMSTMLYEE